MLRLVAILYQEWIQWVAAGQLRCGRRVRRIQDCETGESLRALLECAPDFSVREDDAIIFAQLVHDDSQNSDSPIPDVLKLESVARFFPLNHRGAQLIEGVARRANVRLADPFLSMAFECWRREELDRAAHESGVRFVLSAGFDGIDSEQNLSQVPQDDSLWKPADFARLEKRRNSASFGWRVALAILKSKMTGEAWKELGSALGGFEFPKESDLPCATSQAICDSPSLRRQADLLRTHLAKSGQSFALVQQSALAHWRDRLESNDGAGLERHEELNALARDLRIIEADEGLVCAVEAAYVIGKTAQQDTVNQLYYSTRHAEFPALCVTARQSWLGEKEEKISVSTTAEVTVADNGSVGGNVESSSRSTSENLKLSDARDQVMDALGSAQPGVPDSPVRIRSEIGKRTCVDSNGGGDRDARVIDGPRATDRSEGSGSRLISDLIHASSAEDSTAPTFNSDTGMPCGPPQAGCVESQPGSDGVHMSGVDPDRLTSTNGDDPPRRD